MVIACWSASMSANMSSAVLSASALAFLLAATKQADHMQVIAMQHASIRNYCMHTDMGPCLPTCSAQCGHKHCCWRVGLLAHGSSRQLPCAGHHNVPALQYAPGSPDSLRARLVPTLDATARAASCSALSTFGVGCSSRSVNAFLFLIKLLVLLVLVFFCACFCSHYHALSACHQPQSHITVDVSLNMQSAPCTICLCGHDPCRTRLRSWHGSP